MIPRYNVRGRNRSSSAKYSNSTSLLPHSGVGVRSSSFRINRNTSSSGSLPVAGTSEFCKHIKYCCLHQNTNNSINSNARKFMTSEIDHIDRNDRNREICNVSGGPAISGSIGTNFKLIDFNTYSNYSDDEKSKKFTNNKFSADNNITSNSTINNNANNKSSQQIFDSFDRKCNCGKFFSSSSSPPLNHLFFPFTLPLPAPLPLPLLKTLHLHLYLPTTKNNLEFSPRIFCLLSLVVGLL